MFLECMPVRLGRHDWRLPESARHLARGQDGRNLLIVSYVHLATISVMSSYCSWGLNVCTSSTIEATMADGGCPQ
jgi:hypothetical protein